MLSIYLNRAYSHVKTIRLCANTLVKGVCTSDHYYEPGKSSQSLLLLQHLACLYCFYHLSVSLRQLNAMLLAVRVSTW